MADGPSPAGTLRDLGLSPRKRLGQNFLRETSFLDRILSAAEISAHDDVLEIGAGTGILTAALSEAARRVVAIELDDSLYKALAIRFRDSSVTALHGNALDLDPCEHFDGPYKLVANIPYYITGLLVRKFLEATCQPIALVLMVQREVAERMAAAPPKLNLLGVSVQYYAQVKIVARVPRGAFYPPPKVDSAIVRLTPVARGESEADRASFFAVVRAGFSTRRKQLVNSLANGLEIERSRTLALLAESEVSPQARAETLTVGQWQRLAATWRREKQAEGA